MNAAPPILVVMGVAGSGKTTLGRLIAERLGWAFKEGDELHPPANVDKMRSGRPLNDADRGPWLDAIGRWIDGSIAAGQSGVITCSALKRAYRDRLRQGRPSLTFVYLDIAEPVVAERLKHRKGHYWPASLLHTQYVDLEVPGDDEPVIRVDGELGLEAEADAVVGSLARAR